jgi:hypothetical protein
MWESRLLVARFPRARGKSGKPAFGFPFFPQPGISTTLRWIRSQRTARQEGEIRHHGIEYCDRFFLLDPPLARAVAN